MLSLYNDAHCHWTAHIICSVVKIAFFLIFPLHLSNKAVVAWRVAKFIFQLSSQRIECFIFIYKM